MLNVATTPGKSNNLYQHSVGVRQVSNFSLSKASAEWQQAEQKRNSKDVTPVCISFNNLPQRQACANTNSYNHGIESSCVWWKKNGADQTMPNAVWQQYLLHTRHQCQWEGKGKCSPPSGHSSAIPPSYLFIAAKVQCSHLQMQSSGSNLPRINWSAFFIKWLAVLLKELLRTKGSQGNYLQNGCQGWSDR